MDARALFDARWTALPEWERPVFAVTALLAPCSRVALSDHVVRLQLGRSSQHVLSTEETIALVKRWIGADLLQSRSEGLWMEPVVRWRCLWLAREAGYATLLAQAAEACSTFGVRGASDVLPLLRIGVVRGLVGQVRATLRRVSELDPVLVGFEHPLIEILRTDDAWYDSFEPELRTLMRQCALAGSLDGTADLGEFWTQLRTSGGPEEDEAVAAIELLRGERPTRELASAGVGLVALMQGDRLGAQEQWLSGKPARVQLLPGLLGTLQWVLANTTASAEATALERALTKQLRASPGVSRAALQLMRAHAQASQNPKEAPQAAHVGSRIAYADVATPLLRALYAVWYLSHGYELERATKDAREFAELCTRRGYAWLGAQFSALGSAARDKLQRGAQRFEFGFEDAPPTPGVQVVYALSDLRRDQAPWELSLAALSKIATAQPGKAQPEAEQQLAWLIHPEEQAIEAVLQKQSGKTWTMGRVVALRSLLAGGENASYVTEHDARVVRLVRVDGPVSAPTSRAGLDWERALPALVGHSRVYVAPERQRPAELALGQCSLHWIESSDGHTLLAQPPGLDFGPQGAGVYLCREGVRWVVYAPTPPQRDALRVIGRGLNVPAAARQQLLGVLEHVLTVLPVESFASSGLHVHPADGRLVARIVPLAGEYNLSLGVRPFADRDPLFLTPGHGATEVARSVDGKPWRVTRDLGAERAALDQLLSACASLHGHERGEFTWSLPDAATALAFLVEAEALGADVLVEWPRGESLTWRRMGSGATFSGRTEAQPGWYLVSGRLQLASGAALELSELLERLEHAPGRFVQVSGSEFVALDEPLAQTLRLLLAARAGLRDSGEVAVPASALAVLDALSLPNTPFQLAEPVRAWRQRFDAVAACEPEVASDFGGALRSYQVVAFRWLWRLGELGFGACLADDMGLGKTVTVLALLWTRKAKGPVLVVAPTSVCTNWVREAERFTPGLRVQLMTTDTALRAEPGTIVIVSYALIVRLRSSLADVEWDTVVLDEAHFIKNPGTQRAKAVLSLNAQVRIALTGTPIENRTTDLYSLFRFLNPGLLGDVREFEARHGALDAAPDAQRTRMAELRQLIGPFLLRRTKAEVLADLPDLTVIDEVVEFSDREQRLYDALREEALRTVLHRPTAEGVTKLEILAQITRLRRFCSDPRLVHAEFDVVGSKLDAVIERLDQLRAAGHQVLVFSQFVALLSLLRQELEQRSFTYNYLDGSTKPAERQRQIDLFQAGQTQVFLISLKAGGFGINLTAADYVLHVDPWWNPAVERQATDRAHRSGQTRPVTVYRFLMRNSVETGMLTLHERKKELSEQVLAGSDELKSLSADELLQVLGNRP